MIGVFFCCCFFFAVRCKNRVLGHKWSWSLVFSTFVILVVVCLGSWVSSANRLLANPGLLQSRGCFGCCVKPTPITAVDEPSKRLRIQGRSVRKASLSEDFWSTSAHEMENSGIQSQRSMSSISTVAQSSDQHAAGSSSNPNEFLNQGKFTIFVSYLPYWSTMPVSSVKLSKSLVDYLVLSFM